MDKATATPIQGTVTDIYMVPGENTGGQLYRVHLKYDDGTEEVFNLTASPAFGQLEVASIAGRLHPGDRIQATAVGFKTFYALGFYRNLVNPAIVP